MLNQLLLFTIVRACNFPVSLTYYEATRSFTSHQVGSRQVYCKCNEIVLSHYPRKKWFVLFWMCDFVALTRCCKLICFLYLIFAVLLANLIRSIVCQNNILMVTWPTTRHFKENFLPRLLVFPKTKLCRKFEVPSSSSFEDMFDRMPKIVGVTWPVPRTLWRKFLMHPVGIPYVKLRTKF